MSAPYVYEVRLPSTAFTASRTLIQIKPVTATIVPIAAALWQTTKTTTELWELQWNRWTGAFTAGTVTSATPILLGDSQDPASLAVGGTTATGYNATAEPSGGTQVSFGEEGWNILNGAYSWKGIPEERFTIRTGELLTLKNLTTPAASTTMGGYVRYLEWN